MESKSKIIEKEGDLLKSQMQTLVNAVNCVGVMSEGLALSFKKGYPAMFQNYKTRCKHKLVKPGRPYVYLGVRKIINFPIKNHWRDLPSMESIEQGLIFLAQKAKEWNISSLAIPAFGDDWEQTRVLIHKHLEPLDIPIEIYVPVNPFKKQKV